MRSTTLPLDIASALNTLSRGCEGIDTVMNTNKEENRFSRALEALQRLSMDTEMPIAIVGGLAAIRYGYPAATQDIDIAVCQVHLEQLIQVAPQYGFKIAWESKTGWHTLMHGDVEINIVPEGGKARDSSPTRIPSPRDMGVLQGVQYASIESWVELKISSGRQKDRAHIVEVLKKSDDKSIAEIDRHLANVDLTYQTAFKNLVAEAIEERHQEQNRR